MYKYCTTLALLIVSLLVYATVGFAAVTGTVTDTKGAPVVGATVTFTGESNPVKKFSGSTDDQGKYTIDISGTIGIDTSTPSAFSLGQNYPNPFNPTTTIPFTLESSANVNVSIYNIMGQRVATIVDDYMNAGTHYVTWNGMDDQGNHVSAGIYLYQLSSGRHAETKKMLLLDGGGGSHVAKPSMNSGTQLVTKIAAGTTYTVTITHSGIILYEKTGVTITDGQTMNFEVSLSEDRSAEFVEMLVNLSDEVVENQISNDEFLTQFNDILNTIDNTPNGTELLQQYLEINVLGYSFITRSAKITDSRKTLKTNSGIIDDIMNFQPYKMLERLFSSVTFSLAAEPGATLVQVANSDMFIALSLLQVNTHIYAEYPSKIDTLQLNELLAILATNPYEAERQLLTYCHYRIPSWLQPPNTGTTSTNGTYTGTFSGTTTGTSDLWTVKWDVSSTVTISVSANDSVSANGAIDPYYTGTIKIVGTVILTVTYHPPFPEAGGSRSDNFDLNEEEEYGSLSKVEGISDGVLFTEGTFNENTLTITASISFPNSEYAEVLHIVKTIILTK